MICGDTQPHERHEYLRGARRCDCPGIEAVEPDHDSAAHAWLDLEMTMESMRHNNRVIEIASEFGQRLTVERALGSIELEPRR